MDFAYDQIQGETVGADRSSTPTPNSNGAADGPAAISQTRQNLNAEFQDTFRAFSNSPWGAKLGGFWGNVRKQSETYYEEARKDVEEAGGEALKGFTDLRQSIVNRTRGLSQGDADRQAVVSDAQKDAQKDESQINDTTDQAKTQDEVDKKNDDLISRFRSEAAKRLKDIEKAEDAADEALLRFGTNIRNFLRDAISVTAPLDATADQPGGVLFESKDAAGKRVIHTTRFDAQLHVIHSSLDSFIRDPVSSEWAGFKEKFNIAEKTDVVSKDLEKYPELRRAMEQLVPEKVEYGDFWCRYYFLRLVIETEEQKRKELLRGASAQNQNEEEIGWDEESDEENVPSTPQAKRVNDSSTTIQQIPVDAQTPKMESRSSNDQHSQPDSDASYDVVSGATSRAPGSPKEEKVKGKKDDDSDEEDWE